MGGKVLKLKSEELIEQGLEQGLEQGIRIFIEDKIEDKCPEPEIIKKLIKRFSLTEEDAIVYLEKYGTVLI